MIASIQVLRGLAAILVVLSHLPEQLDAYGLPDIFPNMTFGVFGVDLFFVISGFIMVSSSGADRGAVAAGRFLLRRIIRIVPLYWLFTSLFVIATLHAARHSGLRAAEIRHIVESYLFLPSADPASGDIFPVYPLGWTLNYEMFFYACFALALLLPRRLTVPVLAASLTALVIATLVAPPPPPLSWWGRSQILEFVFGMLIALAHQRKVRLPARIAYPLAGAAIAVAPFYVPVIDTWDALRGLAWGLPAAAIVACAVQVGRRPTPNHDATEHDVIRKPVPDFRHHGLVGWRALEALGDASYSLYLVHYAVFIATGLLLAPVLTQKLVAAPAYALLLFLGSIAAALLLYRAVERPATRALRRLASTRPPVVPAPPPGTQDA